MATVNGTAGPDVIHQAGDGVPIPPGYTDVTGVTAFADSIVAGTGDDVVYGRGGDDTLVGGLGTDTLVGGLGFDLFLFFDSSEVSGSAEIIDGSEGINGLSILGGISGSSWDFTFVDLLQIDSLSVLVGSRDFTFSFLAEQFGGFSEISAAGSQITIVDNLNVTSIDVRFSGFDLLMLAEDNFLRLSGVINSMSITGSSGADRVRLNYTGLGDEISYTLLGGYGSDVLRVKGAAAFLDGGQGRDRIQGGQNFDMLIGGGDDDTISGRGSQDTLSLGGGADVVVISKLSHSRPGLEQHDIVMDFLASDGDLINLVRIDADESEDGDQAFRFVAQFDGQPGALIQRLSGANDTLLLGDVDGDLVPELEILLLDVSGLTSSALVL